MVWDFVLHYQDSARDERHVRWRRLGMVWGAIAFWVAGVLVKVFPDGGFSAFLLIWLQKS